MIRLAALALLVACGGTTSDGDMATAPLEPVRSDSAGVTLLRHEAGSLDRAPRITMDSASIAEIRGSVEDEAADISTITPVLFLADGRLVGRDRQRQVIVVFGADGVDRQEFGRQGAGPGEYGRLGGIVFGENGALLVQDIRNGRLSLFDPVTGSGAEYPLAEPIGAGGSTPLGMIDGMVMTYSLNFQAGTPSENPVAPGVKAVLFDPTSDVARRVFTTGPEEVEDDAPRMVTSGGTVMRDVPAVSLPALQAMPTVLAWNGQYMVADGNRFRLEGRDTSGVLRTVLQVDRPRRAVTAEVWNAHIDQTIGRILGSIPSGSGDLMTVMGGGAPDTAMIRRNMQDQPHADSLPAFERATVSANGTLWVMDYPVPGSDGWAVTAFAPDGRILGRIVATADDPPVAFGDDRLAFRTEDDDGIATITIRKLNLP